MESAYDEKIKRNEYENIVYEKQDKITVFRTEIFWSMLLNISLLNIRLFGILKHEGDVYKQRQAEFTEYLNFRILNISYTFLKIKTNAKFANACRKRYCSLQFLIHML